MILNKIKAYRLWIVGGVLIVAFAIYMSNRPALMAKEKPAPEVLVMQPQMIKMTDYIEQTGNTSAFHSVDLVARVEGYLEKKLYASGTFVEKDTPLFLIEPKPYFEKLEQAKASVSAAEANVKYAKAEYNRQLEMFKQNATSKNSVEMWVAKVQQAESELLQAKSNEIQAEINYSYTKIQAPFKGRVSRELVDVGNLVGNSGSATKLATIEQLAPIYVYLNLNEIDLLRLRSKGKKDRSTPEALSKVPVELGLQNEVGFPHKGRLNYVNSSLDASTGTMQFRAIFENKDFALVPGLFVKLRIAISPNFPRVSIPRAALMYDQAGPYVFTVDANNQAHLKRITLGSTLDHWQSIKSGLSSSDKVITQGMQFVSEGKNVRVKYQKL